MFHRPVPEPVIEQPVAAPVVESRPAAVEEVERPSALINGEQEVDQEAGLLCSILR